MLAGLVELKIRGFCVPVYEPTLVALLPKCVSLRRLHLMVIVEEIPEARSESVQQKEQLDRLAECAVRCTIEFNVRFSSLWLAGKKH